MYSTKLVLIANILVLGLCSANPVEVRFPSDRIVGGYETTIEENPWQVSLQYFSSHRCGGSIIGTKWVLTAAHCTSGLSAVNLAVRVGSSEHQKGGSLIQLKRFVEHPNYNAAKIDFDFSLLELAKPLTFGDQIQSIELSTIKTNIADGTRCRISGWGTTQSPSESRDILRAAIVPIVNQRYCNKRYQGMITSRMICAGYQEGGKDTCQGDSGGPLIDANNGNAQLIGVVSFGQGCARPNYPGVYARVTSVRTWIKSVTSI